ncbi:Fidgetin-like protein 1 [Coemansia thaxteri]|uniref:Fidgetin-like protein 1 n=1 Tax=Coemansia thaxteri TaxID=2663907 RepID=A0A9W8EF37_9FUNG|nr:Fidgetin-like protein 1 [Coemansia thaxteri]
MQPLLYTDDSERGVYEATHFAAESAESGVSPIARELALLRQLHTELRLGPAAADALARHSSCLQGVLSGLTRSLDSRFRDALGPRGACADLGQIRQSAIGSGGSSRPPEPAPTRQSAVAPLSVAPSKRAHSDEVSNAAAQRQQAAATAGYQSEDGNSNGSGEFVTARQQLRLDNAKRHNHGSGSTKAPNGGPRRFVPPVRRAALSEDDMGAAPQATGRVQQRQRGVAAKRGIPSLHGQKRGDSKDGSDPDVDERLKNIEPRMVEMVENEILTTAQAVTWSDIAGLNQAKHAVHMAVIYPLLKPELFTGIRTPAKGLLLFGPPGTGKTLIGRCIAGTAGATFINISASALTSKWIGEGEKMVRALFAVARVRQPTVIFIDEIDSLLTQRCDGEQEATRRIKTEFLVQLDGCGASRDDRVVLVAATNRPHELDEAARRRFPKRLYVPLPDRHARRAIVANLLRDQAHALSDAHVDRICDRTDGFSGADMDALCREAAFGPINAIADIATASASDVRAVAFADFEFALTQVRPTVSAKDLAAHIEFNKAFGMSAVDSA